jgi:UDP-N-acetyl-D-mannosaminuronate dehydrogenase
LKKPTISVLGIGYVGLCTAVGFASKGYNVIASTHDAEKAAKINSGIPPFHEPNLQKLLEERKKSQESQLAQQAAVALDVERILEPVYWENRLGIRPEEIIEPLRDLQEMELRTAKILGNASGKLTVS